MGVSEMDGLKCELIILGISYQRSGRTIITFAGRRVRWRGRVVCTEPITTSQQVVRPSDWARNATVRTQTQNSTPLTILYGQNRKFRSAPIRGELKEGKREGVSTEGGGVR